MDACINFTNLARICSRNRRRMVCSTKERGHGTRACRLEACRKECCSPRNAGDGCSGNGGGRGCHRHRGGAMVRRTN